MGDTACLIFMQANTITNAFKGQVAVSEVMLFGEWNKHYFAFALRFFFPIFCFPFPSLNFNFNFFFFALLNQNCSHHPYFAQSLQKTFYSLPSACRFSQDPSAQADTIFLQSWRVLECGKWRWIWLGRIKGAKKVRGGREGKEGRVSCQNNPDF